MPYRDHHVADGHVLGGEPVGRVLQRVREPEQFLDGRREQRRVCAQPGHLRRVGQQRQGAGGDQVNGGVEARHDQLEGRRKQLGAGQPAPGALVGGEDEGRQQVAAGLGAPGGDQPGQVGGQLPRHPLRLLGPAGAAVGEHAGQDPLAVRHRDAEQFAEHRDRPPPGQRRTSFASRGSARADRTSSYRVTTHIRP
jgi:hypothetical protein